MSYPEQYFQELFDKENINVKYHKQISYYELDFYNDNFKLDIEIDGDTHTQEKVQEKDLRRTEYLKSLGWKVYRIKWSDWKKMSVDDKKDKIKEIKELLQ